MSYKESFIPWLITGRKRKISHRKWNSAADHLQEAGNCSWLRVKYLLRNIRSNWRHAWSGSCTGTFRNFYFSGITHFSPESIGGFLHQASSHSLNHLSFFSFICYQSLTQLFIGSSTNINQFENIKYIVSYYMLAYLSELIESTSVGWSNNGIEARQKKVHFVNRKRISQDGKTQE